MNTARWSVQVVGCTQVDELMVKFSLPDLDSDEDIDPLATNKLQETESRSLLEDEFTEQGNPLPKFKIKRNRQAIILEPKHKDGDEDDYSELFEREVKNLPDQQTKGPKESVRVLNLEDLEDEQEESEESQQQLRQKLPEKKRCRKENEKSYVKLLSKQDEEDLQELGITEKGDAEEDDYQMLTEELEDERLALGTREELAMRQQKRAQIEELIQLQDSAAATEVDLLNEEFAQLNKLTGRKTVMAPQLQPEVSWQEICAELHDSLEAEAAKNILVNKRIETLEEQLQQLVLERTNLVSSMQETLSANHEV